MVDKLHHRATPCSSFRLTVRFVVEIQRFVCDRVTPLIIENLRSNGIAMQRMAFSHTTREPEIKYMDLGRAV